MTNAVYTAITRQSGLRHEMQVLANNIANMSTTGYRAEAVLFSEFVQPVERGGDALSMASARARHTLDTQGALSQTNGAFDLAIEGEGFFQIETPNGLRLTRAGAFTPNADGSLVTPDGHPVLDTGGAPVFVPTGAGPIAVSGDGIVSAAGRLVGQIGVFTPADPTAMTRSTGAAFDPGGEVIAVANPRIKQGFLEGANVNPITQVARMIEVQRAYELGQSFMDKEDARIRAVLQATRR